MKKLTNLLKESNFKPQLGKVYSNLYAKSFIKENDEESDKEQGLSDEQKAAFFEAVKQYRKFGESVYRNAGLSEVYEAIKNMVETASKVTLSETGDWFDGVTVSRHMKRMGESFNIFEKTLKEVSTLQQRLESSYDEIGEVLGKYYEINEMEDEIEEGNEFGAARAKAIAAGNDSFEVDGKTYPVKDVDKDDKENAKEFSNESMKLTNMIKGKLVNEGKKRFNTKYGVGKSKYVVSYHDGVTKHKDGSDFFDVQIFKNQNDLEAFKKALLQKGFVAESVTESTINESPSSEEIRIAMLAVNKQKKYRRVTASAAVNDLMNSLEVIARDIKNGKIKDESVTEGVSSKDMESIKGAVQSASSFMNIGAELKKLGMRYTFATSPMPIYVVQDKGGNRVGIVNKKYATKPDFVHGDTAVGVMENIKLNSVNEAKYDIGMARKGNGLTIYNKAEEEAGDYKNIAHIDNRGNVKFYDKKLPNDVKKKIEAEAQKMKESVNEGTKMIKLKNLMNESFGFGELPSSKLMKMKVSAKDMLDSVNPKKVNEVYEEEDVVEEGSASAKSLLQSVIKGESSRIEGIKLSKKAAEGLLDWLMVSPYGKKFPNLPFHMLLKASFNWGLSRHLDKNSKEYKDLQAVAKTLEKK
jgi:hypothetical protein